VSEPLSIGLCAQAACILDVTSFKPGNVNLVTGFPDMTAVDFLLSAAVIAPVLDQAPFCHVGDTILGCIRATRTVTAVNTNLGIVLLLAPLSAVPLSGDLRGGLMRTLMRLDVADARATYEAIRLAQPGGLGTAPEQDVAVEPTVTLREAMALAADRDTVACQYVNDFEQVFEGVQLLRQELNNPKPDLGRAITRVFLRLLGKYPDSLIARKYGPGAADEVSRRARRVIDPDPTSGLSLPRAAQFAEWLRNAAGGPRNPGTTADLVTASLFVALRENIIQLPLPGPPPG
jgi:triphosphoribosyl-dephospho-CoA synthase